MDPRAWEHPSCGPLLTCPGRGCPLGPPSAWTSPILVGPWLTLAGILGVGGSDLEEEWSGRASCECGQVTDSLGVLSHRAGPPELEGVTQSCHLECLVHGQW